MSESVQTSVKKGFDLSLIITIIVVMILINALLDILGQFVPVVPQFISAPVSTVRGLIGRKKAPDA